jgi:hypothetical protein
MLTTKERAFAICQGVVLACAIVGAVYFLASWYSNGEIPSHHVASSLTPI